MEESKRNTFLPSDQQHVRVSFQPPSEPKGGMRRANSAGDFESSGINLAEEGDTKQKFKGFSAPVFNVHQGAPSWKTYFSTTNYTSDFEAIFEDYLTSRQGDGGENDSLLGRSGTKGGAGTVSTFMILLKAFIGTGVLFVPNGFAQGGLAFSNIAVVLTSIVCVYCVIALVRTKQAIGLRGAYGDVVKWVIGERAALIVDILIFGVQCSFVTTYFIFVSANLRRVAQVLTGCGIWTNFSLQVGVLCTFALNIPLCLLRKVKYFAIPSLVADVFIFGSIFWTYGAFFWDLGKHGPVAPIKAVNSGVATLLGAVLFAFEGIQLCLPIEEAMATKKHFIPVLVTVFSIVTIVMMTFGSFGYAAIGHEKIQTIVLLNLPRSNFMSSLIQFAYVLAIFLTTPLQFFPAARIAESWFCKIPAQSINGPEVPTERKRLYFHAVRVAVIFVLALVAIAGASALDNLVSVLMAITAIPLAFVFPLVLHIKCKEIVLTKRFLYLDYFLLGVGGLVWIGTFVLAIYLWISNGSSESPNCSAMPIINPLPFPTPSQPHIFTPALPAPVV